MISRLADVALPSCLNRLDLVWRSASPSILFVSYCFSRSSCYLIILYFSPSFFCQSCNKIASLKGVAFPDLLTHLCLVCPVRFYILALMYPIAQHCASNVPRSWSAAELQPNHKLGALRSARRSQRTFAGRMKFQQQILSGSLHHVTVKIAECSHHRPE